MVSLMVQRYVLTSSVLYAVSSLSYVRALSVLCEAFSLYYVHSFVCFVCGRQSVLCAVFSLSYV